MKPYPKYKDSGIEWIGEVPEGWDVKKLKWLAKVRLSNIDKKSNEEELTVELCNYVDVYYNDSITSNIEFMKATARQDQIDILSLEEGDILITKDSESPDDIAIPAYVPSSLHGVVCGYHLAHVRPYQKHANGNYLFRSFSTHGISDQFEISANGVTRFGIGKQAIDNSVFLTPPLEEQTAIAAYLDKKTTQIDNLISKKQKLIELLKEERAAIINQAVTKGLNPDASMKDSGIEWIGEIPAHWKVKRLKFLANKVGSGVTPRGGASVYQKDGIPLLRSQNIHFEGLKLDDVAYISEAIHNEMSGSKVKPKDVLLNITGASIGRCCIVPSDFGEANVNQHVCIIRPNRQIESGFLHNYISSDNGQVQIFSSEKGISREGLNFEQLKGFQVLLPPIGDQKDIKDYIESATTKIDQTITKIKKQIDLLQEYRTALISEVVTGKVDVRDEGSK